MRTNKIVCDTNIWYYVENGTIKLKDYDFKYPLSSTWLSLNELFMTPLLYKDPELVFRVIDTMFVNSKTILIYPDDYIRGICFGIDINNNQLIHIEIKALIEFYKKAKVDFYSSLQEKPIFDAWIEYVNNFNLEQKKRANGVKEVENKMKEIASETNYKRRIYEDKDEIEKQHTNLISIRFYELFKNDDELLPEYERQFKLYNSVKFQLIKRLTVTGLAHQENDFEDFDNLIYVNEGDLYWTEENRWLNLIKDSKMLKYLESPKLNKKFSSVV